METPLTPPQKAALVMLALSEDLAVKIMTQLDEKELRVLSDAVDSMDPLPHSLLPTTLEEFERELQSPTMPLRGGDYLRRLATSAVGEDKVDRALTPATPAMEYIRDAKESTLAELLQNEHPQLAAVVLSQLPQERAAAVLLEMPEERQRDLVERVAGLTSIPMRSMQVASESLAEALRELGGEDDEELRCDGIKFAAGLMNELGPEDSDRLFEELEDRNPDLVPSIREAMFIFEDLSRLDERSLQMLMREVPADQLLIALKTASESLRDKFFGAVSKRAATSMREDLEFMPPKRLSEVEEAQRAIVDIAMGMASDGRVNLDGDGGLV